MPTTQMAVFSPIVTIQMPNLFDAKVDDTSLTDNYLKLKDGESIRCVVFKIEKRIILGEYTRFSPDGQPLPVEVVVLLSQEMRGDKLVPKQFINASAMLVGTIKDLMESGKVKLLMTGLQITYEGKKQNKKGASYDSWDLRYLGK
jgi:hypothetical protein